jgi:hypothetical protein
MRRSGKRIALAYIATHVRVIGKARAIGETA